MDEPYLKRPHRRLNPLTGEWILVSPHRADRPWSGLEEPPEPDMPRPYEASCYLCPGNSRAGGKRNPDYTGTYVFDNDFPALCDDPAHIKTTEQTLFQYEAVEGICRVVCFCPRHDLTLPELSVEQIRAVIDTWGAESAELGSRYRWVQVFENKGPLMGCSNPHPHSQIWAQNRLPLVPSREEMQQKIYYQKNNRPLLLDYAALETARRQRVVAENPDWLAVVPFWAVWPFETLLLSKTPLKKLSDLDEQARDRLADILRRLLTKYDNLFQIPFPYSMGWHGAPYEAGDYAHWQLHAHFYPPLLRSAGVRKFMVGYEMLAEAQRDLTAEAAAEQLRMQSEIHYKTA